MIEQLNKRIGEFMVSRKKKQSSELFSLFMVAKLPPFLDKLQLAKRQLQFLRVSLEATPEQMKNAIIDSHIKAVDEILKAFDGDN